MATLAQQQKIKLLITIVAKKDKIHESIYATQC